MFKKILIANRGEIAVRIMRTLKEMGIRSVAIFSEPDKNAYHTRKADEAYPLHGHDLLTTYLDIQQIVDIARKAECDAIHPGYGFLAENADFVKACEENGLVFIGPDSSAMRVMGDKIQSREIAVRHQIPVTEGFTGKPEEILKKVEKIKPPLLVKASAGGGGKGMRIVEDYSELPSVLEAAAREAKSYFGNPTVYVEKYLSRPRHIEVQILADHYGHAIHLYERECSIQRRYQKIIEESPSPTLTPALREKICEAAVRLARVINYKNAGTVEFLLDENQDFYFLEMNTRIQVEHPVTELVTGIDIVKQQILIAEGQPLKLQQNEIGQKGHAIECRIYAEDPENNFMPSPGTMSLYQEPEGPHIRIDTSTHKPVRIEPFFDPMIAKLITWGENRKKAIDNMIYALNNYHIHGIKHNIPFLEAIMRSKAFQDNNISTTFCEDFKGELLNELSARKNSIHQHLPVLAYLYYDFNIHKINTRPSSIWQEIGYWRPVMNLDVSCEGNHFHVEILFRHNHTFKALIDEQEYLVEEIALRENKLNLSINKTHYKFYISREKINSGYVSFQGCIFEITRHDTLADESYTITGGSTTTGNNLASPMPGKVIKVLVRENEKVKKNQIVAIVEAMKMENNIVAPYDGTVEKILVHEGDAVDKNQELIKIQKDK